MKKKLILILVLMTVCLLVFAACGINNESKYGKAITYHSQDGSKIYFDGKGYCNYDGLDATYYIKDDVYYVTYDKITHALTKVNGGDGLTDLSRNVSTFNSDLRTGRLSTVFTIDGNSYNLYADGSFTLYGSNRLWLASGIYYFNDGILALKHERSLTTSYDISLVVYWIHSYIDDNGSMYPVMLSNPSYYREQHDDNNANNQDGSDIQDDAIDDEIKYSIQYDVLTYDSYPEGNILENNGGYIFGETSQIVNKGENSSSVCAESYYDYRFVGWSDGVTTAQRQDMNITQDLTVTAIFELIPTYRLTYNVEGNGSITGNDQSYYVREGENGSVMTAIPASDYRFVGWSDGVTTAQRQDMNITQDLTVTAIFELIPTYRLTYNVEGNGSITGNDQSYYVREGENGSVMTAVPTKGYRFAGWSDGVATAQRQDTDITQDLTVTAIFELEASCFAHEHLNAGDICEICGNECYLNQGGDILMYNAVTGNMYAEYYSSTATDTFDIFADNIVTVYISNRVTSIESYAFQSYSITGVIFQADSQLTYIGEGAFSSCSGLTTVVIPESVTNIGQSAFSYCYGLKDISVGLNIKSVGEDAFYGTAWWESQQANSLVYLGNICYAVKGSLPLNTFLNIKEGTTTIADDCFSEQGGLRKVTLPQSLIWIGSYAFENCSAIIQIQLNENLEHIGSSAFSNCTGLTDVYYTGDIAGWCNISFYVSTSNPMYSADNLYIDGELLQGELIIPDSVTSIGSSAFYNCTGLTSIVIPDSVTSIGEGAFRNCTGLTSIVIPDSVTSIGYNAFYDCSNITKATIPTIAIDDIPQNNLQEVIINGGESIGNNAFYDCTGLTSVTIGNSVTIIGDYAFYNCRGLTSVVIGNSVTIIGDYAFYNCRGLTSVVIGNSVTSIGEEAFANCTGLTSVTIPDSVISIGQFVFGDCYKLTIYCEAVSKPSGWDSDWNFSNCPVVWDYINNDIAEDGYHYIVIDGLKYGIKDSIAKVARYSVEGNIIIPSSIMYGGVTYSVTGIGESAFSNCTGLTSIVIPDSVTSIGYNAFYNCTSLTIYCEAASKPSGWDSGWKPSNCPVVWGYKG